MDPHRHAALRLLATAALMAVLGGLLLGQTNAVSDSEIRRILADRIDRYQQSVGIVVGMIGPGGRRVVSYGKLAAGDTRPLDGDTVFEIGSITKVFTALVLTDMVEHGEVALSDPASRYLPRTVRVPRRDNQEIALLDLATHTSGLPRSPMNVDSPNPSNPFASYSVEHLYQFLSMYRLPRAIASEFEYSNLGSALLGHVLAERAGTDYATLVESRVAQPLGMSSTHLQLTPEMKGRLAIGHAYGLEPTANWDLGALAAAGGFHSTANDLLTFLEASLEYKRTPLAPALAAMLKVRRDTERGEVALGWFVEEHGGRELVLHDGGTGGYRSFVGFNPATGVGVVVLSNAGTGAGVEDIGLHLLNPRVPLLTGSALAPPKTRKEVEVDNILLERYVGQYRFPSSQAAQVTRQGNHLFLKADGDVPVEFYPESTTDFFAKMMDAQIQFVSGTQGAVDELLFRREGFMYHVKRTD